MWMVNLAVFPWLSSLEVLAVLKFNLGQLQKKKPLQKNVFVNIYQALLPYQI